VTKAEILLSILREAHTAWVSVVDLMSATHATSIPAVMQQARAKLRPGWKIQNRMRRRAGKTLSEYRLVYLEDAGIGPPHEGKTDPGVAAQTGPAQGGEPKQQSELSLPDAGVNLRSAWPD
jgi:hypothetical protein